MLALGGMGDTAVGRQGAQVEQGAVAAGAQRQKTLEGFHVADLDNIARIARVLAPLEDRKTGLPRAPTICPR